MELLLCKSGLLLMKKYVKQNSANTDTHLAVLFYLYSGHWQDWLPLLSDHLLYSAHNVLI